MSFQYPKLCGPLEFDPRFPCGHVVLPNELTADEDCPFCREHPGLVLAQIYKCGHVLEISLVGAGHSRTKRPLSPDERQRVQANLDHVKVDRCPACNAAELGAT